MELKVSVDGVPRVVCGVTERTTCQEVVVALAQALGQPGRYTLREKFKDFERSVTPSERLLESLERYGQQAREVQLTLLHNGPSLWEEMSRTKGGRYQPGPQMRRTEAGARMRRGSSSLSQHRQSLPPLSRLRPQAEPPLEELKKPKRKSLTLMEEAWGWLESLGKGGAHHSEDDKGNSKETDKQSTSSLDVSITVAKDTSAPGGLLSRVRGQRSGKSTTDRPTSCCIGDQTTDKDGKHSGKERKEKKTQEVKTARTKAEDLQISSRADKTRDEKRNLRETITQQLACLQDLQGHITSTDRQIRELEDRQKARKAEQEAQQKVTEEEMEQLQFWENELKAEEGYEKDLQGQFLEMKEKAMECKVKLEEYRCKMQGLDFYGVQRTVQVESEMGLRKCETDAVVADSLAVSNNTPDQSSSTSEVKAVPPQQTRERRPTGPTELREWWSRWSAAQSPKSDQPKVMHRTELTIRLGGTRV